MILVHVLRLAHWRCALMFALACGLCAPACAADIAGAKELAFLKRFKGSNIVYEETQSFEDLQIGAPDPKNPGGNWTLTPAEGQVTRIYYHLPSGHTVLEVLRNYEMALHDAGLTQLNERIGASDGDRDFLGSVFRQSWETVNDFNWSGMGRGGVQQIAYVTAQGNVGGQSVKLAVTVANYSHPVDVNYKTKVHFESDQPIVIVDAVVAKGVVDQMVTVKAADMASALAAKGVIDLYGVYFDTDKTDIKPESDATLNEIAILLKGNAALKLEISGHTDNTGTKDHNMKLSQGRADAVMAALVSKYGIDAKRLTARGYGDTKPVASNDTDANKAKNRRVELRKI